MRYSIRLLLALFSAFILSACGTKGPLYQPSTLASANDTSSRVEAAFRS